MIGKKEAIFRMFEAVVIKMWSLVIVINKHGLGHRSRNNERQIGTSSGQVQAVQSLMQSVWPNACRQ